MSNDQPRAVANFREQLQLMEERGDLVRISREVDPEFEMAAVTQRMDPGPVLLFENVTGYSMPVVLGMDGTRDRIAAAIGVEPLDLIARYGRAIEQPIDPQFVDDAPVHEVVITDDVDVLSELPVMTHYEHDGGPYITTGVVIAEDPADGTRNVSYHRLQVTGPDELRGLILPRHLKEMLKAAESRGEPLPVAIALGLDSAQRLAAATWGSQIPLGLDEFSISGALKGRAEQLVACKTIPVHVPAEAEIVIEAEILPATVDKEGPFAEYTGNYGAVVKSPVFQVKAITRRADAYYQGLLAFTTEHHNLLGLPYEPVVLKTLQGTLPNTEAVHITPGGCGKFHVVVRIDKRHDGDGKDAIIAGLHAVRDIKLVTVVDNDVDPFSPRDVEWAMSTRFLADRDVLIVEGAKGNELDPSTGGTALTAKMGIDATKPLEAGDRFERVRIPGADDLDLQDYLSVGS